MKKYMVLRDGMFLVRCKKAAGIIQSFWGKSRYEGKEYLTLATAKKYATIVKGKIFFITENGQLEKYLYH